MGCGQSTGFVADPNLDPHELTAREIAFNLERDDEDAVVNALFNAAGDRARACGELRQAFLDKVKSVYSNNLVEDLTKSMFDGNDSRALIQNMFADHVKLYAGVAFKAMSGIGTNDDLLIPVLCSLNEQDIAPFSAAFSLVAGKSLEDFVKGDCSGKTETALVLSSCKTLPQAYAFLLRSAMKGLGTDEAALIRLLVHATCDQVALIREAYKSMFDRDLVDDLRSETSGDFCKALVALASKKPSGSLDEDVERLHKAMEGFGTDEAELISVLCNKTEEQLTHLKDRYKDVHGVDLQSKVESETTGIFESADFRNTLLSILTPRYVSIAKNIRQAMDGWGKDSNALIAMLIHRSPKDRESIKANYSKMFNRELSDDIKNECSGDFEKVLLALIDSPARNAAKLLHAATDGLGTNAGVINAVLARNDAIMAGIRKEYEAMYNKPLMDVLEKECSGKHKMLCKNLASYSA